MDIALIGLGGSGKTSLLKALAAGHLPAHANPNEPVVAVVKVPDERLDRLAAMVSAKKTTYLELRLIDFPPFSAGKKGPAPQLLGALSTADLLVHVARDFEDPSVPHPLESVNAARDISVVDLELSFADLAVVERRLERLAAETRSLAAGARGAQEREISLLNRIKQSLEEETPIRAMGLSAEDSAMLGGFNFLTAKPLLIVVNIDENDASNVEGVESKFREHFKAPGTNVIAVPVKAEADVAELSAEEAVEFRKELGLPATSAAERLLQEAVSLLGLITFYTAGPQDTHAWSVPDGTTAVKAAGRIHSDIERGFIRAEVIGWQELLDAGSHAEAKRRGTMRVEGKTYIVQDGDVINVLFNV